MALLRAFSLELATADVASMSQGLKNIDVLSG
jgi:hypothetical protein